MYHDYHIRDLSSSYSCKWDTGLRQQDPSGTSSTVDQEKSAHHQGSAEAKSSTKGLWWQTSESVSKNEKAVFAAVKGKNMEASRR